MSEKKELYDKLNALNRKDKLNEAEEAEYGRLWSSAIRFPLGEILKGSRYENMSLNEIGFNDKMVSLLSEKGIMNASDLLSLDRLTADLTPAKWRKIMEKKDVIIGYLPKNYLERWLDEDPTLEPLPVPVNNEDIQAFITLPAYFDLKSIQEIKLDNVRELIDSIGNKLFNILLNNGIYLLSGIFNITQNDNIKGGGKRFNEQLEDLKKDVIEDTSKWINANTCSLRDQEIHIFPSSFCTDDTCSQLISAIKEIYDYISSNQNIKTSQYDLQYLKWRYIDNLPKEEIISKLLETSTNQKSAEQNERNYRKSVISKLLGTDGVYLASNVRLSETLLDELRTISKRILWRPVSDLLDVYNIPIESAKVSIFMDLMGIDTYTYDPQSLRNSFFVNIGDSKGNYDDFVKNIKDFLKTQPLPLSKQAIFDSYHSNINNIFEDEEILLETVLATHPDIELVELDGDCLYQIKYNCLANSGLKIVRIIYEEKRTLSYDEINQMDRSRNPSGKEINAAHSKIDPQYSDIVISPRAGYLCYNTGGIQTFSHSIVLDFIQSYGSNHESFTFDEIKGALRDAGLAGNDKTLRTYILEGCAVNRTNNYLFKLRSTINEKNEEQWKRNRSYGVKNKVLRNAVEILEGKDVFDFEELKDLILKRIPDAEPNLRYRTRKILLEYSCKDEKDPESENALFFFEDSSNQIKLNQKVMDLGLYDLDRIGLIDKKPPYYQKLLAKAVEMLKESKDNKCLLNEIQENCKALIPAEYSLAPFYKLFNADVLKNYSTEIERKEDTNGIIWLSLKEENLQSASFKAKESVETNVEEIAPQLVSVSRPEAEPLLDVNWDTLLSSMRTELSYYGKSIWNLNSSWDNALMKLVEFLRNSQNSLLRERIPRDMITLWNYKIDKYDLYNFLAHLSTSFEALIREIYQKNEGQTPRNTSGLFDTMSLMAETEEWSKVMGDRTCTGFDRILRDLRFRRNDICHGVDVELSTLQMSQTVNNYIALYVYTVANFYRK